MHLRFTVMDRSDDTLLFTDNLVFSAPKSQVLWDFVTNNQLFRDNLVHLGMDGSQDMRYLRCARMRYTHRQERLLLQVFVNDIVYTGTGYEIRPRFFHVRFTRISKQA